MKRLFYCFVAAMLFVACVKEDATIAKIEEVKNPYAVTTDEAVELLQTVIGGESTRAISVGEIKTLRKSDFVPTTRGADDGDLIYIVDLENGGSAIMGADKRMEPIYAILDETKISPEKLTQVATRGDDGKEDIEDFVMGMMNKKIEADASAWALPEMPIVPINPYTYWTETVIISQQAPLLKTKWHQHYPYNNNCPLKSSGVKCAAGCTPIALAQVIYYNQTPNTINNISFDWELIGEYEYGVYDQSNSATLEIANYIRTIGNAINTSYDDNGSFASLESACNLLNNSGYKNVSFTRYAYYTVRDLVHMNNLPVPISGYNNDRSVGHTWVFDGGNNYRVENWVREEVDYKEYIEYIDSSTTYTLLHCNYGYGGEHDGYYSSSIFDLTQMLDNDCVDTSIGDIRCEGGGNYSYHLEMLTYLLD